jgi:hypothetical protein
MKTSDLTGANLNRAVAMALGHEVVPKPVDTFCNPADKETGAQQVWAIVVEGHICRMPNYASDISVAWPILIEHKIELTCNENGFWYANNAKFWHGTYGRDPINVVLRLFVHMKLGDEVELP